MGHFLSMAGFIACKDASPFEAFSCPSPPSSTFYKLLEMERWVLSNPTLRLLGTCRDET